AALPAPEQSPTDALETQADLNEEIDNLIAAPEPSLLTEAAPELAAKDLKSVADSIRGAHSRSTLVGYQRLWRQFEAFVLDTIDDGAAFWKRGVLEPTKETPNLILLWIRNSCDFVASEGTQVRTDNRRRKRKVAGFVENDEEGGRPEDGLGGDEEDVQKGNSYTHACRRIYVRNETFASMHKLRRLGNDENGQRLWAGREERVAMQAAYAIAFLCLLRHSEVLQIEWDHVVAEPNEGRVTITLPFRKTHQEGKTLRALPYKEEPWLDVPHLLLRWARLQRGTECFIFTRFDSVGRVKQYDRPVAMNFRNNLLDINEDPAAFGMHSFRRGGVQYLCSEKRWDIRKLCDWGGRSRDFDNLTIVRYLLGVNDNPVRQREDFLNPFVEGGELCHRCGRSAGAVRKDESEEEY
ncbi:hypothetical protein B0A48_18799, partial [Cryoendolithus antarcticus]